MLKKNKVPGYILTITTIVQPMHDIFWEKKLLVIFAEVQ